MKLLIIDDDSAKRKLLEDTAREFNKSITILAADSAHEGFRTLHSLDIDLVLLDIVLPLNSSSPQSEEGSLWFVKEVRRRFIGKKIPFIVGTTQYIDSLAKTQEIFREHLWSIIHVSATDPHWRNQLQQAIRYALSNSSRLSLVNQNEYFKADVAIVTALQTPEFSELVSALGGGSKLVVSETSENWMLSTIIRADGSELRVVCACADQMGMTAMASLTTKVVLICRPTFLILPGIMAGNPDRVKLSSLVIAESTWNFQAGKLTENGFKPDVHSLPCGFGLKNDFTGAITEAFFIDFWRNWRGGKPREIAELYSGDVACGPFVIADGETFGKLEREQKRKILGLEMEAYGCYEAAHRLGTIAPRVLCIKSVCDFGDGKKGDTFQTYCAALSAAAVVHALKTANLT